jgi:hypothetical protein
VQSARCHVLSQSGRQGVMPLEDERPTAESEQSPWTRLRGAVEYAFTKGDPDQPVGRRNEVPLASSVRFCSLFPAHSLWARVVFRRFLLLQGS